MSQSVKSDKSSSDHESDLHPSHKQTWEVLLLKDDWTRVLRPVNKRFSNALDYHTYCIPDVSSKYDDGVAKSVPKWKKTPDSNEDESLRLIGLDIDNNNSRNI